MDTGSAKTYKGLPHFNDYRSLFYPWFLKGTILNDVNALDKKRLINLTELFSRISVRNVVTIKE